MSRAKVIPIGDGYSVRFLQRAKGQETPYWVGQIFKDGAQVGTFENRGTGGPTIIRPMSVVDAFRKLVDATDPENGPKLTERENVPLYLAEALGYFRSSKGLTLKELVAVFVKQHLDYEAKHHAA